QIWLRHDEVSPRARDTVHFHGGANPNLPGLEYRFVFDNRDAATGWLLDPNASHAYTEAGEYTARLEVRRDGRIICTATDTVRVDVTMSPQAPLSVVIVPPRVDVSLTPRPAIQILGQEVQFVVSFKSAVPRPLTQAEYSIVFGDGTDSGWSFSTTASHSY